VIFSRKKNGRQDLAAVLFDGTASQMTITLVPTLTRP
jgi:hypothetical protein